MSEILRYYNKNKNSIEKVIDSELKLFLKKFPKSKLKDKIKENYCLGGENSKESFSYFLEWTTSKLGSIRGGSAKKHRIYKQKDGTLYIYKDFENKDDALSKISETIYKIANATNISILKKIKDKDNALTDLIFNKICYLYHPTKLLPIYSIDDLKYFAEEYEINVLNKNYFDINKELLDKLYLESFGEYNNKEENKILAIMWFLYNKGEKEIINENIEYFFENEINKAKIHKKSSFYAFIGLFIAFLIIAISFTYFVNISKGITILNYFFNYGLIILIEIFLIKFSLHFFNNFHIYSKIEYIYGYYKTLITNIDKKYINDNFENNNIKDEIRKQLAFEIFRIPEKIENLYNGKSNSINNIIDELSKIEKIIGITKK